MVTVVAAALVAVATGVKSAAAALAAIPVGLVPRRLWHRFPGLPVEAMSAVSGIVTAFAGLAIGWVWFFAYLQRTAQAVHGVGRELGVILLLVSMLAFAALTPAGLLMTYLVASGVLRFGGAMTGEPFGDPLLGAIDRFITRAGK